MRKYDFATIDVFTTTRFGGNQLAVFTDAAGLSDAEMQSLAAEMNYSETTFVLPPKDPANTAHVRIFNRTTEMPFAGHPNVGTAFVLASLRPELGDMLRFEEMAGLVNVRVTRADSKPTGAEIDAPQPLRLLGELEPTDVAKCIGLMPDHIMVDTHRPVRATVGVEFVLIEVAPDKLSDAAPDLAAFREVASTHETGRRLSLFIYARDGEAVRARMFAPLAGTWEDPATGSASATLGALLLIQHSEGSELAIDISQGVEMGRPSALKVKARRAPDGIRASVGGTCVPIFRGSIEM
jgi:trans-2,3-dihydro-3-hydroxyanthranilate isomerase